MKKKILFVTATHGNEGFAVPIVKNLSREKYGESFDWLIANPRALQENKRFIDADLNRVSPGDENSKKYELRRACELKKTFTNYEYVIDLHGTPAKTGLFTIVTNPKIENLILASSLPIQNIVIWATESPDKPGPLTKFINCGVEIECGPKDSIEIKNELSNKLRKLLKEGINLDRKIRKSKSFFRIYGPLLKKDYIDKEKKLNEFEEVSINGEKFYPLLVNRYTDITCYKMKKININFKNV